MNHSGINDLNAKDQARTTTILVREIAKYYMEFLETDFHKQRTPKRRLKIRNERNLLVGLNLNKYPQFRKTIWHTVKHAFSTNSQVRIVKGVHKANIPYHLIDIIKIQTEKITSDDIHQVSIKVSKSLEESVKVHQNDYEAAISMALEDSSKVFKEHLVDPFVLNLEEPLMNLSLGDKNSIFIMQEELTSVLLQLIINQISYIIKLLIAGNDVHIQEKINSVLNIKEIKNAILMFLQDFKVKDIYNEIFEIDQNRHILDKHEFYLYFCDITYKRVKYPIFYIPIHITKREDTIYVEFESKAYINKKALTYIAQQYGEERQKGGTLKRIKERIIYLSECRETFKDIIISILNELRDFFDIENSINVEVPKCQSVRSEFVRLSNDCYISLFDQSDEALVNDYEEILQLLNEGDSNLAEAFSKLIDDFINKNPISFTEKIDDTWDDTSTNDKLVYTSPIPLNSEQREILDALNKKGCNYITVEGPPGTGKSHTITAIVFEAILRDQSVLLLSDKTEALDVAENMITKALNRARLDKKFQNPILRLGRSGSTYSKILSTGSIENIKTHYRAVKKDYESLEHNLNKIENSLKEDIEAEILAYKDINMLEIRELIQLENYYDANGFPLDLTEVLQHPNAAIELEELRKIFQKIDENFFNPNNNTYINNEKVFDTIGVSLRNLVTLLDLRNHLAFLITLCNNITELITRYPKEVQRLTRFLEFSGVHTKKLEYFVAAYSKLKSPIFGYFLKGTKIKRLNMEFRCIFPSTDYENPHKELLELRKTLQLLRYIKNTKIDLPQDFEIDFDYIKVVHQFIKNRQLIDWCQNLVLLQGDVDYLINVLQKYPFTANKIKINPKALRTLHNNWLTTVNDLDFDRLTRFIDLQQKLFKDFAKIPLIHYSEMKKQIEELATTKMTFMLDKRLIDFYEHYRADATAIRGIIRSKRKFDRSNFLLLKAAFPCIIAGIRDYAEYIPLQPSIFDVVVIDEASQVSIAQAFPALLRAKKVVVFGDKKQFSNIKSALARSDINNECLNNLKDVFKKCISTETMKLEKLKKFNIRTSILEFFEFISNYHTQLLKHFRGYRELISYSNKYFYQNNLQVMKIRAKPIEEVIQFTNVIPTDDDIQAIPNTNTSEISAIVKELNKLCDRDKRPSVGIITPHTNQQKLLMIKINKNPKRDQFFDDLKLKIMTFDTCQGEERDVIIYSMVATEKSDRLWGVFIKDLGSVDLEEEGRIKVQRLNVGFSRARECIHFFLSKTLTEYRGAIGEALRHYDNTAAESKKEHSTKRVDAKSGMEPKVLNWFYQTQFWRQKKEKIVFIPQFEIGKYLKQLDKTYEHPNYVVDFLLVYIDEKHLEHRIIIEYDGFNEHFVDIEAADEFNYDYYYSEDDIYRQKVLESYGYKFLRINRFNIGDNPIATLDLRITKLIRGYRLNNEVLLDIQDTVSGLKIGTMKECPKCKKIRKLEDFRDDSLITSYGRFCIFCKKVKRKYHLPQRKLHEEKQNYKDVSGGKLCPQCGAPMVLREGRYGKFYGCTKFPYCRGTQSYKNTTAL